jgi:hypothetical protein
MKKLQFPKIDPKKRVTYVLLAIVGVIVVFISLMCLTSDIPEAVIVAAVLLAASGFGGYFATKRVVLSALCIVGGPAAVALGIALLFSGGDPSVLMLVFGIGLTYFAMIFAPVMAGGLLAFAGYKIYAAIHRKRYGVAPADDLAESKCDEEEPSYAERKKTRRIWLIVYPSFVFAILIFNFIIFLLNTEDAFRPSEPGMWFHSSIIFLFINFGIAALFVVAAIVLKVIFNKKIKISILILCALVLPGLQTSLNFKLFEEGGILHSTIEKGGMFFFVVTRDFNFDGEYAEEYQLLYDDREIILEDEAEQNERPSEIERVEARIIGRGTRRMESIYIHYSDKYLDETEIREIGVSTGYNSTTSSIEIYVTLKASVDPEKIEFVSKSVDFTKEVLDDGRIKLTVDPEDISYLEDSSEYHEASFKIDWTYTK